VSRNSHGEFGSSPSHSSNLVISRVMHVDGHRCAQDQAGRHRVMAHAAHVYCRWHFLGLLCHHLPGLDLRCTATRPRVCHASWMIVHRPEVPTSNSLLASRRHPVDAPLSDWVDPPAWRRRQGRACRPCHPCPNCPFHFDVVLALHGPRRVGSNGETIFGRSSALQTARLGDLGHCHVWRPAAVP